MVHKKGLVLLAVFLLPGCDRGEDFADGRVRIRILTWKPENEGAWRRALDRFHSGHPGIRVEVEIGPNNSTQLHDLLTQKLRNRDTSLDAFLMDVVWTPEFARAGWVRPLDSRFPPGARRAFFPGCIQADTVGGHIYGVPFNTDGGLLFYRKDLLDKYGLNPPRTWYEMIDQIRTIREGEKNDALYGYSGQFKQYEGLVCNMLEFVHGNGGRLDEPDSPEVIEAVMFVRDRIIGYAAPRGVLAYDEQESLDLFLQGGAIFHRNWPYAWAKVQESPLKGRVGIAVLPTFKKGRHASALGGWRFGISAFSRHPDEAWALVEFLTSEVMQKHFAIEAGKAPARSALYADEEVLRANPHFAELRRIFETAVPRPRSAIYPRISNILQRFLHAALSGTDADIPGLARDAAIQIEKARAKAGE